METRQWTTIDKSSWPRGEWDEEPDKMQWEDAATGLPCLIVRNGGGALCGYVGVAEEHPFYGKEYSSRVPEPPSFAARVYDERSPTIPLFCHSASEDGLMSLELAIDVHGGLTFSDFWTEHSVEAWEKFCARLEKRRDEAAQFPVGDAARALRTWAEGLKSFDAWKELSQAKSICHIPAEGEAEKVWWFGFDCAHSGDASPAYEGLRYNGTYKTVAYVKQECARLAVQLKELGK